MAIQILEDRFSLKQHSMSCDYHMMITFISRWLQHDHPEKSAEYYIETADYLLLDEKKREAGNAMKDAVRMYCRTRPRQ